MQTLLFIKALQYPLLWYPLGTLEMVVMATEGLLYSYLSL